MKNYVVLVFMTVCAFTAPMMLKEKRDLNKVEGGAANTVKSKASTEGGAVNMLGDAASTGEGAAPTEVNAANTEESTTNTEGGAAGTEATATSTATTTNHTEICAPQTPCAWSAYHTYTKELVWNIRNKYCVCGPGTDCYVDEDDKQDFAYVYRCRTPPDDTNTVLKRSI